MRCVVQRVDGASVEVDGTIRGRCEGRGLVVFAGLEETDSEQDLRWMAEKIANLRIFPDEQGKMNKSVLEIGGGVLVVPNFTVAGEAAKGRRPSFDKAMRPERSEGEFQRFAEMVRAAGVRTETGVFRADMRVGMVNDGPVTIWIDSKGRAPG